MSALLVDTHIFVRWRLEPDKLTRAQQRALRIAESRSTVISISAITIWELALLAVKGLAVHFGGLSAIEDLSLEVREGEVLSMIGTPAGGSGEHV